MICIRWTSLLHLKNAYNSIWCQIRSTRNVSTIKMAFDVFESPQTNKNLPPLVIMHGLLGSKQNWRGISRALASKLNRQVFTVDARNHGDSPHTAEQSYMLMAADVVEFIKSQGYGKAFVLGHSMGGRTMMYATLKYPDFIQSGIIVDISPIALPRDFAEMDKIFTAMKNISAPSNLSMADGRKLIETQIKSSVDDQKTVDFILLNLRKRNTGEFYWLPNIGELHNNLQNFGGFMEQVSQFSSCKTRMSFICGIRSKYVDPNHWPQILQLFPNSEIHWLDAGHLVHFDKTAEFINLVFNFVTKN